MAKRIIISPLFVGIIAGIGMFLSTLDSGIVNVAIPSFIQQFHSNITQIAWVITFYTLVISSTIIAFGRLADRYGRVRIYQIGIAVFLVSSILCGFANHASQLIAFRGIQGLGAAMMQATAAAIIMTYVEESHQVRIFGLFGMILGLGPTLGPPLGGLILSSIGWRWIFWLNIPICLVGLWGCRQLKNKVIPKPKKIGVISLILYGISMVTALLSLSNASKYGINNNSTLLMLITAIIGIGLLVVSEKRSENPIVGKYLLSNINFIAAMMGTIAFGGATAIAFILPPIFFEGIRHYLPWQVGLICLSAPIGIVLFARIAAKNVQRFGVRNLMILGLILMLIALISLAQIQANWTWHSITVLLFIYGVGGGIFQTPSIVSIMAQANNEEHATIGAVTRMVQNAAIAVGAFVSAIFISGHPVISNNALITGIKDSWWFAAVLITIALLSFAWAAIKKEHQPWS